MLHMLHQFQQQTVMEQNANDPARQQNQLVPEVKNANEVDPRDTTPGEGQY